MLILFFNSNSVWFETPTDVILGDHICDGDLFKVRCFCNSWPVSDLYQEWGVGDFPEQTALAIAHFHIQIAPDEMVNREDHRAQSGQLYWIMLNPEIRNAASIPVLCDSVDKHFFWGGH